jgi:Zn-dependent protease
MSIDDKGKKKTLFGSLSILGVLALKFKVYILAAWKAIAVLKLSWLLSPLLSIGVYSMLWGWPYAFAIVLLLFIHEMGHWIWMKCLGLNPKAPVFIPGIGAYVAMTKLPPDQTTHAWVAIAGPLVGGIGCAVLYTLGLHSGNHWLTAAGSTGFMLNLLQLVPAKPLDGGFIIQAVSRWLLIPGTVLLLALAFCFHSVLLLIIGGISAVSLVKQFMPQPQPQPMPGAPGASSQEITSSSQLTPASVPQRIVIALAYLSLAGMLAYLYWLSTSELVSLIPPKH